MPAVQYVERSPRHTGYGPTIKKDKRTDCGGQHEKGSLSPRDWRHSKIGKQSVGRFGINAPLDHSVYDVYQLNPHPLPLTTHPWV